MQHSLSPAVGLQDTEFWCVDMDALQWNKFALMAVVVQKLDANLAS